MIEKSMLINDKFKFDFDHMLCSLAFVKISTLKSRFISFLARSSMPSLLVKTPRKTTSSGLFKNSKNSSNKKDAKVDVIQ